MPKLNIPFRKYADEAYDRQKALEAALKKRQDAGQSMLGGKATAMGEKYMFNDDGSPQNVEAAKQAFDATQNIKESERDDQAARVKINTQKAKRQAAQK